jgi:AcrR family transcriptional regulator
MIAIPRKRPRQDRSRALVEAIVEAAAKVLAQQGRDAVTTNAIAIRAGVSIGSLYQYFPNVEAILAAVADQHLHQVNDRIASDDLRDTTSLADASRRIIAALFAAHRIDPALHLALASELGTAPMSRGARALQPVAQTAVAVLFQGLPQSIRSEARCRDYALAVDVVAEITHALAHAAIGRPDQGSLLEGEAEHIVLSYLQSAPQEMRAMFQEPDGDDQVSPSIKEFGRSLKSQRGSR